MPDTITPRIKASFDAQSMMATLGAELSHIAPGAVEIAVRRSCQEAGNSTGLPMPV